MSAPSPTLVDPRTPPKPVHPRVEAVLRDKLVDDRDAVVIQDALVASLAIPAALLLFVPGVFSWPLGLLYLAFVIPRLGPQAVVLHISTHRRLFNASWRRLNEYVPWVLAFFYGMSPGSYMTHHLGMHHVEGNEHADTSTTKPFQRDSVVDFCHYWLRFQFIGKLELLGYLREHARSKLARRLLIGEALHKGAFFAMLWTDWRAAMVVVVVPYLIVRWGLMMGNWGQHAFIDPAQPDNAYRNSVTLINTPYNRRMYNDGYHCAHHIKANAHWAEAPATFEESVDAYARNNAVVFDGLRGFQHLWVLLMLRRYDVLARHLVVWDGVPRSHEDRVAWLQRRVLPIPHPVSAPLSAAVMGVLR